ncbi:methionine biosynthesis protein MetW [Polycyclovorans algicola]|uniref:methionine biosynthesis protein MetW n=1 Tax=Polycyclovorans algicola TaxID=616992 RepID=UPI0004A6F48E|nr:methionine biosynthesis protein MetW [Polycyclovorans algicola]
MTKSVLRPDFALISRWIPRGARVLDLGCGDGELLSYLVAERNVTGYGLDIDEPHITACIRRGLNVIESDINDGLRDFADHSFDVVIMSHALQALTRPDEAVADMLRVGRQAIVTFPNFGHWRVRTAMFAGRMPLTPTLPDRWFDTPNIHLCTVNDFEVLCRERGWAIRDRHLLDRSHRQGHSINLAPNLFGEIALYLLEADAKPRAP